MAESLLASAHVSKSFLRSINTRSSPQADRWHSEEHSGVATELVTLLVETLGLLRMDRISLSFLSQQDSSDSQP